ncbi:ABC transporter permease [Rhodovarius lipocyclicus]|uniref:ABC transporter permease n=1 Tax=Rhodovarius lipocyclicus TaxID=268410 RepID=UPI0013569A75|nr:ABC transporter permease [Rhodovarius lipocyclicus]
MLTSHQAPAVRDAAHPRHLARALEDLSLGFSRWRLPLALAQLDLRNRYRGSVLGPFWITLSTAIMLGALGFLYARLFRLDVADYLPFLATSLTLWNLISGLVNDGTQCLTDREDVIRQMPQPYSVHVLRCVLRHALAAAHVLPLVPLVFLLCGRWPGWGLAGAVPGLFLFLVNGVSVCMLLGMVAARFRDMGPIMQSGMQLLFFVTPIIWKPELLGDRVGFLALNPVHAMIETVRGPLLGQAPSLLIWAAALTYTAILAGLAFTIFVRWRGRIAFWV